jgi:hypothetical protein
MALIEDLRNQMHAEIRTAQQSARRAEGEAEAERSKYLWAKKHPSWGIDANLYLMQEYLSQAGIQISEDSLDLAFGALRGTGSLAERPVIQEAPELTAAEKREAENNRLRSLSVPELRAEVQANIKKQLATPEYGGHGAVYVAPFTAAEFKQFSPRRVKEIMHYPDSNQERPGVRAGIDKLLREAQLLKEATN